VLKCCRDADAVSSVAFSQMVRLSPVEVVTHCQVMGCLHWSMSVILQGHTDGGQLPWSDGILASGSSAHTVRHMSQTVSAAKLCPVILAESCQLSSGQTVKLSPVAVKIRRLSAGTETGECLKTLKPSSLCNGMNLTGVVGLTEATIATLKALGAVEV